ncbi:MAG: TlyA family RNA methyltransferase [Campylobacteraceae bacterium]|nr:TlyA family RNA methyltransferase [Campylobacteraceae bacterium]
MRLDLFLVETKFFESRAKAQAAILDSEVWIDGQPVLKPALEVNKETNLSIIPRTRYVSRAGVKLKAFLPIANIDIKDKHCVDVGSSTGGFTQVLLEEGALSVCAVDVGSEQLHHSLRENLKIKLFEQTNIVDFVLPHEVEILTCDLAFVSTTSLLDLLDKLKFKYAIILFKPQFEVGKTVKRDKKGVVKDIEQIKRAKRTFETATTSLGWEMIIAQESALKGKEGNVEFFYAFRRA